MKVLKFLLPLTFFFWLSCQNDELQENMASATQKQKVEQKSLKDLPLLIPVIEKMKKIRPKSNTYARTTETFLGVENVITDDIYVYSDSTGYKTYSFKIENIHNTLKFENLHLIETTTGYVAYIMSYDPDPSWLEEKKLDPHNEVYITNYVGDITKYSLEREVIYSSNSNYYTTNSSTGSIITICSYSLIPHCFGRLNHDHSNGINDECTELGYLTVETCASFYSGGEASSSGDSGTNNDNPNNAGGSTNNPDPCPTVGTTGTVIVGTQPVSGIGSGCTPNETVVVSLTPAPTPCSELKKLTNDVEVKNSLNTLKDKIQETKESGFAYRLVEINGINSFLPPQEIQSSGFNPKVINMANHIGSNYIGASHIHPDRIYTHTAPMFSPEDLRWLARVAVSHNNNGLPKNYSVYFLTLTVGSGTYAIKIKNMTKLLNIMNRPERFAKLKIELEKAYFKSGETAPATNLQKDLLKIMDEFDLGVGLFKASDDLSEWSELILNPSLPNARPIEIPCN